MSASRPVTLITGASFGQFGCVAKRECEDVRSPQFGTAALTYHSIVLPPSSVVVNDVDDVFVMSTGVAPSTPAKSEYCVAPSTVFQMNVTLPAATLEPSLGVTSDGGSGQTTTLNRRVVESVGVHEAPTFARTNQTLPEEQRIAMRIWLAVLTLDIPVVVVLSHGLAVFAAAALTHGNISLPEWLERLLRPVVITLDLHLVHHSIEFSRENWNYGAVLSIWDRLFGSYTQISRGQRDRLVFGVRELPPRDCLKPLAMLLTPWRIRAASVN